MKVRGRRVIIECKHGKHEIYVNKSDYNAWQNGTLIQTAMPYLTHEQRELLISGSCNKCWDEMFPNEDE